MKTIFLLEVIVRHFVSGPSGRPALALVAQAWRASAERSFAKNPRSIANRSIQSGCMASNVLLDGPEWTAIWPSTPPRRMPLAQRHPWWHGLIGRSGGPPAQNGLHLFHSACPASSSSKNRASGPCTHSVTVRLERVLEAVSGAGWCSAEASRRPLSRLRHAAMYEY